MNRILPFLTALGAAGWLTSLILYTLTFWNVDASSTSVHSLLTIVLIAVWVIAIQKLIKDPELKDHRWSESKDPLFFFKIIFKGTPSSIQLVAAASLIFALFSFAYLMFTQTGVASIIDGNKVLHNHGDILKELTAEEYTEALVIQSRQLIGHYVAYFGVGTAILWPNKNGKRILP